MPQRSAAFTPLHCANGRGGSLPMRRSGPIGRPYLTSMPNYEPLVDQIAEQTGVYFRASSPFELAKLEAFGLPESVLDFYREFEPSECAEGQIRLWPIEHILEENEALVPGCYSVRHGYVVFATTLSGDTYCFDVTRQGPFEPRIVLLSHEVVTKHTTAAQFARLAKPVARNLYEFLQKFVRREIDEDCIT